MPARYGGGLPKPPKLGIVCCCGDLKRGMLHGQNTRTFKRAGPHGAGAHLLLSGDQKTNTTRKILLG
jgi:hypothetical protein